VTVFELSTAGFGPAESDPEELRRELEAVADDPALVRAAFGRFPSGVAALCAVVDGEQVGMVATSFSVGVSFSPPLVMFSVQNSSTTWPKLRGAREIGISVLGAGHAEVCLQLASRSGDRFRGVDILRAAGGAILIEDSTMWIQATILSETPAGDHHIVVLEVTHLSVDHDIEPLVYQAQKFHGLRT
jgi:flavin reductase (DIM6/NTAB) family NADH-FMN oxidoreductase RutF